MEQSAAKRRKLSPTSVTAATEDVNEQQPTGRDGSRNSAHRASFMSPTKASLARFNPNLLPPAQPIETRGAANRKSPAVRTRATNTNGGEAALNGITGTNFPTSRELSRGEEDGERNAGESASAARNGISAAPRRQSQTPTAQRTVSKVPQTQPAPGLRSLPSRTTNTAPQPERSGLGHDIAAAEQDGNPPNGVRIDEATMDKLPHTPTRHGVPQNVAQIDNSGPSLPSTPSQLGLEAPYQRPKGPLFGRPDKGAKKKQRDGSSPLKSKENTASGNHVQRSPTSRLGSKVYLPGLPKPPPTLQQVTLHKKVESRKKLEKEALSSESTHLRDVLLSSWQNNGGKEAAAQQRQGKKVMDLASKLLRLREDIENLESLIVGNDETPLDHIVSKGDAGSSDPSTSVPHTLQQRLSLFFPFSYDGHARHSDADPDPAPPDQEDTVRIQNSKLLNWDPNDPQAILQKHNVEFTRPNGTSIAALAITVNSTTLSIHDLNLLDEQGPPAMPELQAWLLPDKHDSKDLTSIGTAISRCSAVTDLRAACWRTCRERHADLVVIPVPTKTSNNNNNTINHPQQETQLTFQHPTQPHFSLSISWTITLRSSDGEAESSLDISLSFPPRWIDEGIVSANGGGKGEVKAVREAFELLVQERGVTEGVLAIVKLLFPDSKSDSGLVSG